MREPPFVSSRFPVLSLTLGVAGRIVTVEALLDTGFDGDVAVPLPLLADGQAAEGELRWVLADGSTVVAPYYLGELPIGPFGPFEVLITGIGDEPLLGRGRLVELRVTLDYRQRVIVEP
jgi:predicted aspartyl protease